MLAELLMQDKGFRGLQHACLRRGCLDCQLSCRNGNGNVADMAHLAVLLVERLTVPVNQGMQAEGTHHHDEHNGQDSALSCL